MPAFLFISFRWVNARERRNFIANALELCLSCINPSICSKRKTHGQQIGAGKEEEWGRVECRAGLEGSEVECESFYRQGVRECRK